MPRGEAYLQEIKKGGTNIDHFDSRSIPKLNMGLGAEKGGKDYTISIFCQTASWFTPSNF